MKHRYHQQALGDVPGAEPKDYSPRQQELAPPQQQTLALDGGVLGPLFNHNHNHEVLPDD